MKRCIGLHQFIIEYKKCLSFYSYEIVINNMVNDESAQVQVEVRMKRSPNFFGNLIQQEFELEPLHGERKDWPTLVWNDTILKPSSLPKWTNGDVIQKIEGLKRDAKYKFSIRVITQMIKGSSLSHKCEDTLSTALWPCRNGNQSISSKKVIDS